MITDQQSDAWRPKLTGWSRDILRFYSSIADSLPHNAVCVELGVWCGRSLIFLAEELAARQKRPTLVGVDLWPTGYGFGGFDDKIGAKGGVFPWSLGEMLEHGGGLVRDIRIVRWESDLAASLFDNGSVDLLFVDAAHDYEHVSADLEAWARKISPHGIMAGHDYDPVEYPGVYRAVNEFATRESARLTQRGESESEGAPETQAIRIETPVDGGSVWRLRR